MRRGRRWTDTAILGAAILAAPGCAGPHLDDAGAEIDRISAGITFFEARRDRDPGDPLSHRQLIRRYGERFALAADFADVERAEKLARDMIPASREPGRDWARLSAVLLMQHRFAEAMAASETAVRLDPDGEEALGAHYDAALAIGAYVEAYATLRRLPPREVATKARWVGWHLGAGNLAAASSAQDQACRGLELAAATTLAQAWCATEQGRMAEDAGEARAHFARALVFQPGYRGALEGIASLAHAAEDWTTSRRIYRSILSPAHPDLHRRLAEAERGLGNLEAARAEEQHFARLVAGPEQEALQAPEIVRSLLQRGPSGWESALAVSRREIARRPTIESWALLVEVHTARGEYAEAREAQLALDAVRGTIAIPSVLVPAA